MQKCKYYNDCQTAVVLMLDDFSLTATTIDKNLMPYNDWGYGLLSENSIYKYLDTNLLSKYPEIKGTVFFPIAKHALQNEKSGYTIFNKSINKEFKNFINEISAQFELAFHGTTHGKYIDINNPCIDNNWLQEFEYLKPNDFESLKKDITKVEEFLELKFYGGKYPGYKKNEYSDSIIERLGFKWWASSADMINKKCNSNKHSYFGDKTAIINMPTNVSGSVFNKTLFRNSSWKNSIRKIKKILYHSAMENYLQYLYDNGLIISIQEHFQNLKTDGARQTPNIYDDINSLDKIFGLLRNTNVWHANCTEIACYIESYDNTVITNLKNKSFIIKYNGLWDSSALSYKSNSKEIKELRTKKIIQGFYKQGYWIFNNLSPGEYKELII